jgi:hypothetical protein
VPRLDVSLILAVGAEIGRATALGGLLLFSVRRYRRLPFPGQPGETLLVLLGIGAAISLVDRPLYYYAYYATYQAQAIPQAVYQGSQFLGVLLLAVLYLLAAIRTRIPRWRVYFVTALLAGAITILLLSFISFVQPVQPWTPYSVRRLNFLLLQLPPLLTGVAILFVAVKDAREVIRYRWTHWLGVGIGLWIAVLHVMSSIWFTCFDTVP